MDRPMIDNSGSLYFGEISLYVTTMQIIFVSRGIKYHNRPPELPTQTCINKDIESNIFNKLHIQQVEFTVLK
jgi:hypothetical protein